MIDYDKQELLAAYLKYPSQGIVGTVNEDGDPTMLMADDTVFKEVVGETDIRTRSVTVAIADVGVPIDGSPWLTDHRKASLVWDMKTAAVAIGEVTIIGGHGTVCATTAIWGAQNIKFVDLQLTGPLPGADNVGAPFKKVACPGDHQADIISFSVNPRTWLHKLAKIADTLPETLIIVPSGNDGINLKRTGDVYRQLKTEYSLSLEEATIARLPANVLVVGGVGRDLKRTATGKYCQRGSDPTDFGEGELIETVVPADYSLFWMGPQWQTLLESKGMGNTGMGFDKQVFDAKGFEDIDVKGFKSMQGTSMAAPLAANVAAKCKLICPGLKGPQLKTILLEASGLKEDTYETDILRNMVTFHTGGGVLDPAVALGLCKSKCEELSRVVVAPNTCG